VVERYDGKGRLHLGATPAAVRAAMVADWYEARRSGESVAMLALRRRDVAELNARARALLVADGTVADDGVVAAGRTFAVGDRVVCGHNDRRLGVHNALFATVVAIDAGAGSLTVEVDGGGRILVPSSYLADGHLHYAYATTIHKAQGATCERTLLLGDDRLYREAGYTGLSRGRGRNDLYVVVDDDRDVDTEIEPHGTAPADQPHERLVRVLLRSGAKTLASDEGPRCPPEPARSLRALWLERDPEGVSDARLADLDRQIAWRAEVAARAAEIDRPAHLVAVLGEPPLDLTARNRWRQAAALVESHLARHDGAVDDLDLKELLEVDPPLDSAPEAPEGAVAELG